ncbi:MAG: nitroreductase family deazaflavin-dependent oxidoreductase [Deltaproteobacteria bacterium]|nr:nitroreductase family deazaflavin-dependent oxidoreductase [Deltaproteobacteria bacterium]
MRAALLVSNPTGLRLDRWLVAATGFSFVNQFYARAAGLTPRSCLLLTTRHHKTGATRSVVLPYQRDAGRILIVGSHGGRPTDAIWAMNLRVHPDCEVRLRLRSRASVAHEAMGDERDHVWKVVTENGAYLGYEKMAAPRVIPVFVLVAEA